MSLPFNVTVLYPYGAEFKIDYYLSSHMPMVYKNWEQYGLQRWEVIKVGNGPDGSPSPYSIQATLVWNDADSFMKALGSPEKDEVLGDIPNFSNKEPIFVTGAMLAKS